MHSEQLKRVARSQWRRVDEVYRSATASIRTLPDFLIVGEAKCGTTSLYDDIVRHPFVREAAVKEVHFFDIRFHRGLEWYRAQFPIKWRTQGTADRRDRLRTGEASPYYMFHPHALSRIRQVLPSVKLIAMLRNPVERAYSQYQHELRHGRESLASFEEAIEREPERLRGEVERMLRDERYNSVEHRRHSYVTRGIYVDQLENVRRLFDSERLLIVKSEEYFEAPDVVLRRVLAFLELPTWEPRAFVKRNVGSYVPMDPRVRRRLMEYFAPHNARLADFIGVDFAWS